MSDILLETLYNALGIKPRKENTAAEAVRTERLLRSGMYQDIIIRRRFKNCKYCGGSGVRSYEIFGGNKITKPCSRCDGTGRRIEYEK